VEEGRAAPELEVVHAEDRAGQVEQLGPGFSAKVKETKKL
jgi:hypothetical protein